MSTPYGYGNVMGGQATSMANSITMSAMMPPPPPPPPQGLDFNGGLMQNPVSMSQGMPLQAMPGGMAGGGMINSMAGATGMQNTLSANPAMIGQMIGPLQPPPPPPVNPATNNAPLDFNVNKNRAPTPMTIQSGMAAGGMMDSNNMVENMNIVSSSNGGNINDNNMEVRVDDDKDGISGSRRDRDRDGSRGRDRDRERDNRDRRGRDRDRDRDRTNLRGRLSRDRDSPGGGRERDGSPGGVRGDRRDRRRDDRDTASNPAPMDQYTNMASNIDGQQFNQMWGPMWNPMGGTMAGPMAPMGPMTPMAGPMGGPVGPMGPMTPMGPMGGPMGPTDGQQMSGEFRITWGMFGWMMSPEGLTVPIKNQLQCKHVTLVPPNRLAPPPTTRDRPLGCRTVFVGGLPENITEEMVVDVFERCGEITTVRLSKKNFAHIRYELEEYVENAIFLSGYRMRIGNNTDSANTGRLHVDYAQARDDLFEWECRQRALQREQRHRERMEAERLRPPSPPPVPHYTEHEASIVADQLKGEEGSVPGMDVFSKAATTLVTWLQRGECNKRNIGTIYSMIQSVNSQVRRLAAEKIQYEDELTKFREQTHARLQGIVGQFSQIEKVFTACSQQKVWDHFTKAQRRNIESWKKQAEKIKRIQLDDSDKEDADEMEVSDDDGEGRPRVSKKSSIEALKEENDSLRCQLEAYKNEVDMVKVDLKADLQSKEEQISTYKQTLQGMQQTLTENVTRRRKDEVRVAELQGKLKRLQEQLRLKSKEQGSASGEDKDDDRELIYEDGSDTRDEREDDAATTASSDNLAVSSTITTVDDKAAWLIGLTSTFLHIHPKGASVDYIWSYIQQFDKDIKPADVETMLNQFPSVYKQITTGVGACLERKWIFTGFKTDKPLDLSW